MRCLFAARIVVGHIGDIGEFCRDRPHQRPLAAIAVAAAAEDNGQSSRRIGSQCCYRIFQRIGGVRIVDENRRAFGAASDEIETALRSFKRLERVHGECLFAAGGDDESCRDQGIRDLKGAGQRQKYRMPPRRSLDFESLAEALALGGDEPKRIPGASDGEGFQSSRRGAAGNLARLWRIGIDDRRRAGRQQFLEQPHLGGEIILEAGMIVEMVAADVGKGPGRQPQAVEAALRQAMARCLDRQMIHMIVRQRRRDLMQLHRIGCRVLQIGRAGGTHQADCAEARGAETHGRPDFAHEGGNRSLAVGASDRHHEIGLAAEEARRHQREEAARIRRGDDRYVVHTRAAGTNDGCGAIGDCLRNEPGAVDAGTGKCRENEARLHLAAVGGKPRDGE